MKRHDDNGDESLAVMLEAAADDAAEPPIDWATPVRVDELLAEARTVVPPDRTELLTSLEADLRKPWCRRYPSPS